LQASVVLPDDTSSASSARRFVRDTLHSWGLDEHTETATLLISELVTNAVLHAQSAPEVILLTAGTVLRVEVHDQSPVLPARRHYGLQAGTGRGIVLVEEMASGWGAEPSGAGKVVWFELRPGSGLAQSFALDAVLDPEALSDLSELFGMATGGGGTPAGADEPDRDPGEHVVCRRKQVLVEAGS
jgi:anti-sigma regulatory factor (Ser/Thr protein kinase)